MKKTESYFVALIAIVLILIRATYYLFAYVFDKKIDYLQNISEYLIYLFFIYITFKYIQLLAKNREK